MVKLSRSVEPNGGEQSPYQNASVERAFAILECFGPESRELSLRDICARTGLNKATAFRFLAVLTRLGYVEKHAVADVYSLGYRLLQLASRVDEYDAIRKLVHPELERLAEQVDETVHLARLHHDKVTYCDKVDTAHSLRIQTSVGAELDAHATGIGKVLLAYLTASDVLRLYAGRSLSARTPQTISSLEELQKRLADIRMRGYGFDNEEFEVGLRCVAAPIFNHRGEVPFAVSVSGPTVRMTDERLKQVTKDVIAAARRIQALLYPAA